MHFENADKKKIEVYKKCLISLNNNLSGLSLISKAIGKVDL